MKRIRFLIAAMALAISMCTPVLADTAAPVVGISTTIYEGYTIIVNTNSKKYHVPGCASVSKMKEENKGYCSDAAYLNDNGYSPCKNCH